MVSTKQIANSVKELPTIPEAVAKLSQLIQDEEATSTDFEEIIARDPALTANLLRLANSPYFGLRREVTSVKSAVTLMGAQRVFEVAASAGFSKLLPKNLVGYDMSALAFWQHSIAVAALGEKLSTEAGASAPGLIFTAGLLHDVGKLVIGAFLREKRHLIDAQVEAHGISFLDAELNALGTDHAKVGMFLINRWNLPVDICHGTRWHHSPGDAPEAEMMAVADFVHLADITAHAMGFGADRWELARRADPDVMNRTGLTERQLEKVMSESHEEIVHLGKLFDTVVG